MTHAKDNEGRPTTHEEKCELAKKKMGDRLRAQGFIVHDGHPSTVSAPPQPDAAKTNTGRTTMRPWSTPSPPWSEPRCVGLRQGNDDVLLRTLLVDSTKQESF